MVFENGLFSPSERRPPQSLRALALHQQHLCKWQLTWLILASQSKVVMSLGHGVFRVLCIGCDLKYYEEPEMGHGAVGSLRLKSKCLKHQ